jgi:hypothetical protein
MRATCPKDPSFYTGSEVQALAVTLNESLIDKTTSVTGQEALGLCNPSSPMRAKLSDSLTPTVINTHFFSGSSQETERLIQWFLAEIHDLKEEPHLVKKGKKQRTLKVLVGENKILSEPQVLLFDCITETD